MPDKKAVEFFSNKDNCVTSIMKAFKDDYKVSDSDIEAEKKMSGGRAEDGLCGALYAAKRLLPDDDKRQKIEEEFSGITGSKRCREIRKLKKASCAECVGIAAKLLKEINEESRSDFFKIAPF